jgi:hypothetical protein
MAFHPTGLTLLHQQAACQIVRGAFTLPYRDLAAARKHSRAVGRDARLPAASKCSLPSAAKRRCRTELG